MENVTQKNKKAITGAIKIDEKGIRNHLDGQVRQSVEDTLNVLLNAEADEICQVSRYQRSPDRQDTRAGSYLRKLLTKAGEIEPKVPQSAPVRSANSIKRFTGKSKNGACNRFTESIRIFSRMGSI